MELGLISEPSLKGVSPFATLSADGSLVKTNAAFPKAFLSINSPIELAKRSPPREAPLGFSAKMSLQSSRGRPRKLATRRKNNEPASTTTTIAAKRNVYATRRKRELDRANNSTMENFWKSCKRKARRRSEKRENRDYRELDVVSEADEDLVFDRARNAEHPPRIDDRAYCPTCNRGHVDGESLPVRPSRCRATSAIPRTSFARVRVTFRKNERSFVSKNRSRRRKGRGKGAAKFAENVKTKASEILSSLTERSFVGRWKCGKRRRCASGETEQLDPSVSSRESERRRSATINREARGKAASSNASSTSNMKIERENRASEEVGNDRDPAPQTSESLADVDSPINVDRASTFAPIQAVPNESEFLSIETNEVATAHRTDRYSPFPRENDLEDKGRKSRCKSMKSSENRNEERASSLKRHDTDPNNYVLGSESARKVAKSVAIRAIVLRKDEENPLARRVTRGSTKVGKDRFVGKLVWGSCSGWWPALIIDADHVGMLPESGKLWVYWIGEARISLLNEKTQIESFSCNLKHRLTHNLNVARVRAIDATMQMLRKRLGCALTKPYASWIENNFSELIEALDEIKFYPYPPRIQQRLDYLKEKNAKVTEKFLLDQKREAQGKKITEKSKESPQRIDVDLTRLPLKEQNPGVITWAKIAGHNWWPAMIIDYRDCCMREPSFGCQWIMWYGDYKLSEVHHQLFLRFDKGIEKMRDYINNTKKHVFLVGVLQASKDYCSRLGFDTENWTLSDVFEYFSTAANHATQTQCIPSKRGDSVKIYDKYSAHIVGKLNELKTNPNVDDKRAEDIKNSDDLRSAISGRIAFESLCLKCLKIPNDVMEIHPFFEGSLCKECSEQYKPCMFVFGNDAKCFYCTICAASGTVIICDKEDCPRVYCTACMKHLLCPTTYEQVLQEDPWECFLCSGASSSFSDTIVRPRSNWKDKMIDMFRTSSCNSTVQRGIEGSQQRRKIRVLSLFDGLSTGLLVLRKLGLLVDVYYASEIDTDALMVSASHFGDRIVHLGDIKDITKEKIKEIAPIDLLIGGSPCNDLSLANPARLGLYDPKGTGILFFEYRRILELVKKLNNGRHLFWLYENVASMPSEYRLEINKHLGQEPDAIDSADFSPQHRLRLYWHNLPIEPHSLSFQGEQDVQDILTPHCQRYALVKKIRTVTTKVNSLKQGKSALKPILMKDECDSLWITELEEIFGFPRHYTDVKNLSATKRQRLIGKSWSVQTLTAILSSLCPFFECNTVEAN